MLDKCQGVSARWYDVKKGDLVWILSPGVRSGKIGLVIGITPKSQRLTRVTWRVLVEGEIMSYVDYLLSPIRDEVTDAIHWC